MPLAEHVVNDYQTIRLSLKEHPMRFLREHYARLKFVTADRLTSIKDGRRLSLAGLVPWVRPRSAILQGFVLCCLAYRLHLAVQGRFTCSCLGVLPQWTPWLDASVLSGVSWALLGVLGVAGILAWREDAPAPRAPASAASVPKP